MLIQSNIKDVVKGLSAIEKKQIPYAISVALNNTAKDAQDSLTKELINRLKSPIPFTQRAIGIKRSSKANNVAEVFVKDIQAQYLKHHYFGTTRQPKGKAIATPTRDMKLNKYGNMTKSKVKKLLQSDNYFSGVVKGAGGERRGVFRKYKSGKVRQVLLWKDEQKYDKLLDFKGTVEKVVKRRFNKHFDSAWTYALRTAN